MVAALLICARTVAAELHPIVEVQTGYFFGAVSSGKWLKAEESAKSLKANTNYGAGVSENADRRLNSQSKVKT
jgi:hypothetical protein